MSHPDFILPSPAAALMLFAMVISLGIFCNRVRATEDLSIVRSRQEAVPNFVSFCDLVRKPNQFHQQVVRTTAILIAGYEQSFLYSPRCNSKDSFVWAQSDASRRSNSSVDVPLEAQNAGSSSGPAVRRQVVLVGSFIATKGRRFGHLDQFRMQFLVMRMEKVTSVPSKVPWPSKDPEVGGIHQAEQTVRDTNREFVLHLAGASNYSAIPWEILADDFRFIDVNGNMKTKEEFLASKIPVYQGKIYDTDIRVYLSGNTAVATGLLTRSSNDSAGERSHYINKYVRRGGQWRLVSSQLKRL